jgi:aerobic carbon-monoxide dehydrogenase large subunit
MAVLSRGLLRRCGEQAVYDENGNLLTATLTDYAVPTSADVPEMELDETVTPSPHNPLGVKGVGETGTIAATPAVVNAVLDAISHLGIEHIDMPLTPTRIWEAVEKTKSRRETR